MSWRIYLLRLTQHAPSRIRTMWKKPLPAQFVIIGGFCAAFALSLARARIPQTSSLSFYMMLASSALVLVSIGTAFCVTYRARKIRKWQSNSSFDTRHGRPLVLYGAMLLLGSLIWAYFSPRFVDDNSASGVIIVLSGMLILIAGGITLIMYRVWTRILDLFL